MNTRILLIIGFLLAGSVANAQWKLVKNSSLIPGYLQTCFAANDTFLFLGTTEGSVLRSSDSGKSFQKGGLVTIYPSTQSSIRSVSFLGKNLFANTEQGTYRSTDKGDSWSYGLNIQTGDPLPGAPIRVNNNLYTDLVDSGLARSTDNGVTWTPIRGTRAVRVLGSFGVFLYGEYADSIYRLTDGSQTWTLADSGLPKLFFIYSATTSKSIFISAGEDGIFSSTNSGSNWVQSNLTRNIRVSALATFGDLVFAGTRSGAFVSSDEGMSWMPADSGFTSSGFYVDQLFVYGDILFSISNGELWSRPISDFLPKAVATSNNISTLHLAQNYPNPFTESTTLNFDLPERAFASLKVYDITGREVAVLANEMLDVGSYSRTFNAEKIPNGTYICRLEAGGFRQERTLFLLR